MHSSQFLDAEKQPCLIVRAPDELTDELVDRFSREFANKLYEAAQDGSFSGKSVILRLTAKQTGNDLAKKLKRLIEKRRKRIPKKYEITILFLTKRGCRSIALFDRGHFSMEHFAIDYIKQLVNSEHAIYRSENQYKFQLPSGENADYFIRLGNIQKRTYILDDLFYICYEKIRSCASIVGESWSISTICYHFAKRLDQIRASSQRVNDVVVRFMSRHYDGSKESLQEIDDIAAELISRSLLPSSLIFSVTSTGKTLSDLEQRVHKKIRVGQFQVLSFINVGSGESAHSLSKMNVAKSNGESKAILRINRRNYFPDYIAPREKGVIQYLNKYKNFYEKYAGRGVFSVHKDATSSFYSPKRHHAFHIDAAKMFETEEFLETLEAFDLTLHRNDDSRFVFFESEANRLLVSLVSRGDLDDDRCIVGKSEVEIEAKLREEFRKGSKRFVFLDAILVTGQTLGAFHRLVRNALPGIHVQIVIGIARPDNENEIKSQLSRSEHVHGVESQKDGQPIFVERVVLPNWGIRSCPFCKEMSVLEEGRNVTLFGNQRLSNLRSLRAQGMANETFAITASRETLGSATKFGERSLFMQAEKVSGEVSTGDLVCCAATASQLWRTADEALHYQLEVAGREAAHEKDNLDHAAEQLAMNSLLSPTTFSDPVIKAALWRVFKPHELFPFSSKGRERAEKYLVATMQGAEGVDGQVLNFEAAFLAGLLDMNIDEHDTVYDAVRGFFQRQTGLA